MQRLFFGTIAILTTAIACSNVIGIDQQAKLDPDGGTSTQTSEPAFADETSACDQDACTTVGGTCEAWGCTVHDCETASCQGRVFQCPPGESCNIECSGSNCDNTRCAGGTCRFDCTSASCGSTTCEAASCEFYCNGTSSCYSAGCPSHDTTSCSVECGKAGDACLANITCCGKSCPATATCPP